MKRLFIWHGHDTADMDAISLFEISSARRMRDTGRRIAFLAIFLVPVLGLRLFGYVLIAKSRPAPGIGQPVA